MTVQTKTQIKSYFVRGAKPTQAEFGNLIDSYQDYSAVLDQINTKSSAGRTGFVDIQSPVSAELQPYGTVGLQVLQAQTATSAKQVLNIGAAVSAEFATTAQAIAGAADGISMSPVLTRNAIEVWALTSADFATTAQAIAGTNNTAVMNPVLTKNAIESLSTSGLTLITTTTGVSTSALSVTSFSSTYNEYELHIYDVFVSANPTTPIIRVSRDGGASWDSGALDYAYTMFGYEGGTQRVLNGAGNTSGVVVCTPIDNTLTTKKSMNGVIHIFNPLGDREKQFLVDTVSYGNVGGVVRSSGTVLRFTTSAINGVQLSMTAGSFSGIMALYGVKK